MKKFNEALEKNTEKLELYVPVVARVHGETHPEFHDVKRVYDGLMTKVKNNDAGREALAADFAELRTITTDYTVPGDTCETYEAVYQMLEEIDEALESGE